MDLGIYTIKTTKQAEQLLMAEYTIVLAFLESLQVRFHSFFINLFNCMSIILVEHS